MKNNRFNAISIVPVRSLEVGDLIAMEFLRGVVSGRVTGIAYSRHDLNDEQLAYMKKLKLIIPEDGLTPLGGPNSYLIFGEFDQHKPGHMYVDFDINVAVFHPQPRPGTEEV